jgi:hypothetical protein
MSQDFSIDVDEDLCSILSLGMNGDSVWGGGGRCYVSRIWVTELRNNCDGLFTFRKQVKLNI